MNNKEILQDLLERYEREIELKLEYIPAGRPFKLEEIKALEGRVDIEYKQDFIGKRNSTQKTIGAYISSLEPEQKTPEKLEQYDSFLHEISNKVIHEKREGWHYRGLYGIVTAIGSILAGIITVPIVESWLALPVVAIGPVIGVNRLIKHYSYTKPVKRIIENYVKSLANLDSGRVDAELLYAPDVMLSVAIALESDDKTEKLKARKLMDDYIKTYYPNRSLPPTKK